MLLLVNPLTCTGVITLLKEHVVCKEGEALTPEQTRLLKLMDYPMAEFKLNMIAMWSRNGTFERFREDDVAEHGGDGADSDGEVELDDEVEIGDDDDDDDDAATA
jgi:mRNA turnover protein 4